jgi:hypothetical protein
VASACRPRVGVDMTARAAGAAVALRRSFDSQASVAVSALAGSTEVGNLVELTAVGTDQNVLRVSRVIGNEVAGEEIDVLAASCTVEHLDPQEILHRHVGIAVERASGAIAGADVALQRRQQRVGCLAVDAKIKVLDLFADDPRRHRVDIESEHVAADAVSLQEGGAAAHEGIGDNSLGKIVCDKIALGKRTLGELGEYQAAEEGAGAAGKPFMDGDDRSVILLDLLLLERQSGDQGDIEACFNGHEVGQPVVTLEARRASTRSHIPILQSVQERRKNFSWPDKTRVPWYSIVSRRCRPLVRVPSVNSPGWHTVGRAARGSACFPGDPARRGGEPALSAGAVQLTILPCAGTRVARICHHGESVRLANGRLSNAARSALARSWCRYGLRSM